MVQLCYPTFGDPTLIRVLGGDGASLFFSYVVKVYGIRFDFFSISLSILLVSVSIF